MIHLDGSRGEGGGQILRTALALSALTGRPLNLTHIRAGRAKPGLLRQHLTAVQAAAATCDAEVDGAWLGSQALTFRPGPIRAVELSLDIGSAGACSLVIQTVLPILLAAPGSSRVEVAGGTHNPAAPPFPFLERCFVPLLRRMGADVDVAMPAWGFYPAGGGRLVATLSPARLQALTLRERGAVRSMAATAVLSAVPFAVAQRELATLAARFPLGPDHQHVIDLKRPRGPGNAVWLEVEAEHITEVFTGFGDKRTRAEDVAAAAADQADAWLAADAPVGPHLADQLLLPLALAGRGAFRTTEVTEHLRTNAAVITEVFGVPVRVDEERREVVVG
jgi:RNA 3'-terminal phosphate cyclase (ATP)